MIKLRSLVLCILPLSFAACSNLTPAQQAIVTRVTDKALLVGEAYANAELQKLEPKPSATGLAK